MTSPVAIIGAGPAGLMAAETVAATGRPVVVYDRMPSPGRKFLMAGRGGLNLTHSEPHERFVARYGPAEARLRPAFDGFGPDALRAWAAGLGESTVVGSSGRVFPASWKASPLLRAWLRRLEGQGVRFVFRHRWVGFRQNGALRFETPEGPAETAPAATILALGGGSWPRLGSDGAWAPILAAAGIVVAPLRPANGGVLVAWSDHLRERFAGAPLKRIAISIGEEVRRGEAIVTAGGLEGGAIYAVSSPIRAVLDRDGHAALRIDLRPDLALDDLAIRLSAPRGKQSASTFLRKAAGLSPVAIALMREEGRVLPAEPAAVAALVKAVPVTAMGHAGIDRAISTAGGVAWPDIDETWMLRARPGTFVAGEMLDWEAPTGGYLLQACMATGRAAGVGAMAWLGRQSGD